MFITSSFISRFTFVKWNGNELKKTRCNIKKKSSDNQRLSNLDKEEV